MIDNKTAVKFKNLIFELVDFREEIEFTVEEGNGIGIEYDNGIANIKCSKIYELCRALMIISFNIKNGKKKFSVNETASFKKCGAMLDLSRNGAMNIENIKKYLLYMASIGMNVLYLYLEDMYELKDYPHFGYMRGRYTKEEIQEIDSYARMLDIEVIASIQTLGHMEQYLRWQEAKTIKDTGSIMLVGEEETYKLIDASIKFWSEALETRIVHIGMDEAYGIGFGTHFAKNGYCDQYEMFRKHLERVCEICDNYGVEPMMWSDMFFKLGSKKGEYWDTENEMSEESLAQIPDVDLVYWDYYHDDEEYYESMMKKHKAINNKLIFAGGVWTWDGLVPNYYHTFDTMKPAIRAAIKCNADEVYATLWEDDGCQTNHFFALPGLVLFSEYCYQNNIPDDEVIYSISEHITKIPVEALKCVDVFTLRMSGGKMLGTQYVWCDILLDTVDFKIDYEETLKNFETTKTVFGRYAKIDGGIKEFCKYAELLSDIALRKCKISKGLKKAYNEGDIDYIKSLTEKEFDELLNLYEELKEVHMNQWISTYKVFGWEVINARYAILIERIKYAAMRLRKYINGEIDTVEELDFPTLYQEESWGKNFKMLVTGSVLF